MEARARVVVGAGNRISLFSRRLVPRAAKALAEDDAVGGLRLGRGLGEVARHAAWRGRDTSTLFFRARYELDDLEDNGERIALRLRASWKWHFRAHMHIQERVFAPLFRRNVKEVPSESALLVNSYGVSRRAAVAPDACLAYGFSLPRGVPGVRNEAAGCRRIHGKIYSSEQCVVET